jgi:hypothetical protein
MNEFCEEICKFLMKMRTKNRMDEENQESMKLGIYKGGRQKLKSSGGDRRYVCEAEKESATTTTTVIHL